ncbi:MAG: hypothetical protein [Trichoderma tomentosum ormycovirus 1]|nr:MAG: hypothetical protein [Trichoderma tomentosum ormycovirus 1]
MEDSLTDMLALSLVDNKITSIEDCKLFVKTNLPKFVFSSDALILGGALDRIVAKLLLFSLGKPAPRDGKLGQLVKSVKVSEKYKVPIVNLYHIKGTPTLLVRLPEFDKSDTASIAAVEKLMTLLHYTTGVAVENMNYVQEASLGKTVQLDVVHNRVIDELTASAQLPSGAFPGDVIKIGDYQANLPCILASLHFLARKGNFLRRRTPQGKETVKSVSSQELRNAFNVRAGLSDKSKSFSSMLLKSALACITSTTNRIFPGGWIKSNRDINKVKSDSGLLYKMGYCEKVPYHHKLMAVIYNTVRAKPDKSLHLTNQSGDEYKVYSFLEFRAGTVLTAPVLNQLSGEEFKTQANREPLAVRTASVLENFSDTQYHKAINSLNRAHALLTTCGKGNSKTKPIHYEIARNEFLHTCAKVPIRDGLGSKYLKLSALPDPIYDHCCKLFRFKTVKGKRSSDDDVVPSVEVEMVDAQVEQPPKRPRIDPGRGGRGGRLPRSGLREGHRPVTRGQSTERGLELTPGLGDDGNGNPSNSKKG